MCRRSGFGLHFVYAKAAFHAGASYVVEIPADMMSKAQALLGNGVTSNRKLAGRAVGFIDEFVTKLTTVQTSINDFLRIVTDYQSAVTLMKAANSGLKQLTGSELRPMYNRVSSLVAQCVDCCCCCCCLVVL